MDKVLSVRQGEFPIEYGGAPERGSSVFYRIFTKVS